MLFNLIILIYTGYNYPLVGRHSNKLEFFNELFVCFITFCMTCFTPWVLGYNINLIPEKYLSPVKELQPYEPIHESYGHMMNALMFYYLYINLSVIFYHTIRSLKLIFIKYFRLCRR